jgi:hypothetical protein
VWTDWFGWLAAHSGEKVEPTSMGSEAYTPTRMHPEVTCWRSSSVLVEYDPTFGVMEAEARAEAGAERAGLPKHWPRRLIRTPTMRKDEKSNLTHEK